MKWKIPKYPTEVGLTCMWAEWSRHKEGPPLSSHNWKEQLLDGSVRDVHTTAHTYLFKLRFGSDWCPWEKRCAEVNLSWSCGPPYHRVDLKECRIKVNLCQISPPQSVQQTAQHPAQPPLPDFATSVWTAPCTAPWAQKFATEDPTLRGKNPYILPTSWGIC